MDTNETKRPNDRERKYDRERKRQKYQTDEAYRIAERERARANRRKYREGYLRYLELEKRTNEGAVLLDTLKETDR
jgi:hypothetical protein